MKTPFLASVIFTLCSCAYAAMPVAVNPYTIIGRVTDAQHAAFDTNRTATVEVADASGNVLARTETFFRADSRRNYAISVPMATAAVDGSVVQGNTLSVSVTDDLGKVWSGVVVDATAGAPGGVREVDIVLGEDLDGDGIDDELYRNLLIQWEASDYWTYGESFDPKKDHDGDGVSTIAEALSGTDPFNSEDVLRITAFSRSKSAARSAGETVALSFLGIGGRSYSVETATDLSKKDWTKCSFETDDSAGEVNVISFPSNSGGKPNTVYLLPKSSTNAFFRIRAE